MAIISTAKAQTNLDFENWSGTDPAGWESSNGLTTANSGSQTVFQESNNPGQGNYSLKLVTASCPDCPNYLQNTFFVDCSLPDPYGGTISLAPDPLSLGVPYTKRPISVDFMYESNPVNNDIGSFHLELTKYNPSTGENDIVGEAYFETKNVISNWTQQNIPIVYYSSDVPDTLNIEATSSVGSILDCSNSILFPNLPSPYNDWGLPYPQAGSELYLDNIIINLPSCDSLKLTTSGSKTSSPGVNDGSATANVSGGTSPYTFSWSNGASTQTINNLSPGSYSVTIEDVNGCKKTANYIVTPPGCNISISMSGNPSNDVSIYNGTGSATVNVTGNSSYNFTWNNGATDNNSTTSTINNLAVGTYAVLVEDVNDAFCTQWGFYTVLGPNSNTSGISNISLNQSLINVYPNPSNTHINIVGIDIISGAIYSLNGEIIDNFEIQNNIKEYQVSHLNNGIYILQVKTKNGDISHQKLIVNH